MPSTTRAERNAQQMAAHEQYVADMERGADPIGRAREAIDRGLPVFQTELVVSHLVGGPQTFGASGARVQMDYEVAVTVSQIEDLGWRLDHVGYVFVETGATSSNRPVFTGQGYVNQGETHGIYLFRRDR